MKAKMFRSISVIATVATSIAIISSPSHAFTWDDVWNVVKKGAESSINKEPSQPNNSNDDSTQSAPTSSGLSDAPSIPDNNNSNQPSSDTSANSQPVIRRDDLVFRFLGCKKEIGYYGGNVKNCHFKITYVGNEEMGDFQITNARTVSAIDGNQYTSNNMTVAGQGSISMIKGQPIHGVISFDWSPGLKKSSILEFETNHTSRKILLRFKPA